MTHESGGPYQGPGASGSTDTEALTMSARPPLCDYVECGRAAVVEVVHLNPHMVVADVVPVAALDDPGDPRWRHPRLCPRCAALTVDPLYAEPWSGWA